MRTTKKTKLDILLLQKTAQKSIKQFCDMYVSYESDLSLAKQEILTIIDYLPLAKSKEEFDFYIFTINYFLKYVNNLNSMEAFLKRLSLDIRDYENAPTMDGRNFNNLIRHLDDFIFFMSGLLNRLEGNTDFNKGKLIEVITAATQINQGLKANQVENLDNAKQLIQNLKRSINDFSPALQKCQASLAELAAGFPPLKSLPDSQEVFKEAATGMLEAGLAAIGAGELTQASQFLFNGTEMMIALGRTENSLREKGYKKNISNSISTFCAVAGIACIFIPGAQIAAPFLLGFSCLNMVINTIKNFKKWYQHHQAEKRCEKIVKTEEFLRSAAKAESKKINHSTPAKGTEKTKKSEKIQEKEVKKIPLQSQQKTLSNPKSSSLLGFVTGGLTYKTAIEREFKLLEINIQKKGMNDKNLPQRLRENSLITDPILSSIYRKYPEPGATADFLCELMDCDTDKSLQVLQSNLGKQVNFENFINLFYDSSKSPSVFHRMHAAIFVGFNQIDAFIASIWEYVARLI